MADPITANGNETVTPDDLRREIVRLQDTIEHLEAERDRLAGELERLEEVRRTATGVVRTAHRVEIHHDAVVPQWWDALKAALKAALPTPDEDAAPEEK